MSTYSQEDLYAVADFCLIPMGRAESSVAEPIAECQRVLAQCEDIHYKMHGYGTNIEGKWSNVTAAIHACHAAVHAMGIPRIATDIRIGTRTDRNHSPGQENDHKVRRVEEILAKPVAE